MKAIPTRSIIGQGLLLLALAVLAGWLWTLHPGWPTLTPLLQPRVAATLLSAAYLGFCLRMLRPSLLQPSRAASGNPGPPADWLVVYASQTGFALDLAQRTAQALRETSGTVCLQDIAHLNPSQLATARCLFVVSTTGEGDPPDTALDFVQQVMRKPADLHGTRYAVLALGDRNYDQFCAFGRRLDVWLQQQGAQPLFDRVEIDNADPAALRHWQHHVGVLTGHTEQADWAAPRYERWTLASRRLLNPGCEGNAAWHIELQPATIQPPQWEAGDIVEIGPRNAASAVSTFLQTCQLDGNALIDWQGNPMLLSEALARAQLPQAEALRNIAPGSLQAQLQPLPHREYSIASLPADGRLHLLVRFMQHADGSPGLGSGWLCLHAPVGGSIDLRIRSNPNFHPPAPSRPMILIGNGTGLAGLRAHLKARIAAGAHRNWLLFGERHAAHDGFHGAELEHWLAAGKLERLDRVFSRDHGRHRYVQDALRDHLDLLRQWIADGAAIYVCGSLQGMAPGVDAVLEKALGRERLAELLRDGSYRRDVY